MTLFLLISIPVMFAGVHFVEMSASHARLAGLSTQNNMLSYSIQQSVYLAGRFLLLFLLPCLGLIVDKGASTGAYQLMVHAALVLATLVSIAVFHFRQRVTGYFAAVIARYHDSGNLVRSLATLRIEATDNPRSFDDLLAAIRTTPRASGIAVKSAIVYAFYGSGIFISFYFALVFPDYRASISQMSGLINGFAAVLLTFYIEPAISRSIDKEPDCAETLIYALILGRIIGVAVLSHILLRIFFAYG